MSHLFALFIGSLGTLAAVIGLAEGIDNAAPFIFGTVIAAFFTWINWK